jgi:poly(hydroxyalkanoate) depolymerase family esterase
MDLIDWRELYASNQAVIERAGGRPSQLPSAVRASAPLPARLPGPSRSARVHAPSSSSARRNATIAGRTLRFLIHVPRGVEPQTAAPLVCMLHGCSQDAAGFAAITGMNEVADRHGFVVVYPQQDRDQNPQGCWNWFLPEHQARGAGEPAAIAATVREVIGTMSPGTIDSRRVFVAGLSAGGAMAMILASTYPDLFSVAAVHSGLAYGSATNLGGAFAAMARGVDHHASLDRAVHTAMAGRARPLPSIIIHGSADGTVAPINADQLLTQAITTNRVVAPGTCGDLDIARPSSTSRGQLDGGHAYTRSRWTDRRGGLMHELLMVEGLGHAWSGGAQGHSWSDPRGPNATEAIWRFFQTATSDCATDQGPTSSALEIETAAPVDEVEQSPGDGW